MASLREEAAGLAAIFVLKVSTIPRNTNTTQD